jgi:hypothetical protein
VSVVVGVDGLAGVTVVWVVWAAANDVVAVRVAIASTARMFIMISPPSYLPAL